MKSLENGKLVWILSQFIGQVQPLWSPNYANKGVKYPTVLYIFKEIYGQYLYSVFNVYIALVRFVR